MKDGRMEKRLNGMLKIASFSVIGRAGGSWLALLPVGNNQTGNFALFLHVERYSTNL
jgi:hypothetical protein